MLDTCRITRQGVQPAFDPDLRQTVYGVAQVVYEGKCKVQQTARVTPSTSEAGAEIVSLFAVHVHIPMAADGVQVDDDVEIRTAVLDRVLVGTHFRVVMVPMKSFATARRLSCAAVHV